MFWWRKGKTNKLYSQIFLSITLTLPEELISFGRARRHQSQTRAEKQHQSETVPVKGSGINRAEKTHICCFYFRNGDFNGFCAFLGFGKIHSHPLRLRSWFRIRGFRCRQRREESAYLPRGAKRWSRWSIAITVVAAVVRYQRHLHRSDQFIREWIRHKNRWRATFASLSSKQLHWSHVSLYFQIYVDKYCV